MNFHRIVGITVIATLGAGVGLSVWMGHRHAADKLGSATAIAHVSAAVRALRPTYPYSIIPGGVYSRSELQTQLQRDAVARLHYADFKTDDAHLVASTGERLAYVSFRQHGQVFWTSHKLRIPKGELLLTDGHNWSRTRCGNRIADKKPSNAKLSADEPTADLNMPTASGKQLNDPRLTFSAAPADTPHPAPANELASALAPELPWTPLALPFEWKPNTQNLSATAGLPGGSSLGNIFGGPFVFPRTTPVPTTPAATTPSGTTTGGNGTPTPVIPVPLTAVPEPGYAVALAGILAICSFFALVRGRRSATPLGR